jgi:hypothetical protein
MGSDFLPSGSALLANVIDYLAGKRSVLPYDDLFYLKWIYYGQGESIHTEFSENLQFTSGNRLHDIPGSKTGTPVQYRQRLAAVGKTPTFSLHGKTRPQPLPKPAKTSTFPISSSHPYAGGAWQWSVGAL